MLEEMVALSVKHNVSDLHLCSDSPPRWRRSGLLEPAPFPAPDVKQLLESWLNDEQQGAWWANGQVDFALTLPGEQRLRGSAFSHINGVSVALRILPVSCPKLAALGAPKAIPALLAGGSGLILVSTRTSAWALARRSRTQPRGRRFILGGLDSPPFKHICSTRSASFCLSQRVSRVERKKATAAVRMIAAPDGTSRS